VQQVSGKGTKRKLSPKDIRKQEERDRKAAEARAALDGSRSSVGEQGDSAVGKFKVFKWKRERLK
jgi:hypothetical protein